MSFRFPTEFLQPAWPLGPLAGRTLLLETGIALRLVSRPRSCVT